MLQAARAIQYLQKYESERDVPIDLKPWNMFLDEKYQTLKLSNFNQIDDENTNMKKKYITIFDEKNFSQKYGFESWGVSLLNCYMRIMIILSYNFNRPMFLLKSYQVDQTNMYENGFINWIIRERFNKTHSELNIDDIVEKTENYLVSFEIPEVKFENHPGKFENNS